VGRVRPDVIVAQPPAFDDGAGFGQGGEDLLVQALTARATVEALDEAVLLWLAGRDVMPVNAGAVDPFQDGAGLPRQAIRASNSRASRLPLIEVSTTRASASRVKSSTMARIRNRRRHDKASDTKSRLQRWFGPSGSVMGACVPVARLRLRRRRTASPSSR
jgi:hypothetical protein